MCSWKNLFSILLLLPVLLFAACGGDDDGDGGPLDPIANEVQITLNGEERTLVALGTRTIVNTLMATDGEFAITIQN